MPLRSATRRYDDLATFLKEYPTTLKVGAVTVPPEADELAPEIKLDVVLPGGARVGPMLAQVVFRLPDGSTALRIPEPPPELKTAIKAVMETVEVVKAYLLQTGQVVPKGPTPELEAAKARLTELESELSAARAERDALAADLAAAKAALDARHTPTPAVHEGASGPDAIPAVHDPSLDPAEVPAAEARGRGYPYPDLSRVEPVLSGTLSDRSFRDALMVVALEKHLGIFTITYANGKVRRGFWEKGGPVAWRTDPVDEEEVLGVLLFRAKQITKEQLAKSLEMMEETGCRQGEALIEMGVIAYPQLVLILQKQAEFVLQRVMADREGTWTFHLVPRHLEKYVAPPVRVAALLFKALKGHAREMTSEQLATALRPLLDQYVFLAPNVARTVDEMKLSAEEAQFIKILSSTSYRLRELFSVSNLSRSQTAVMTWVLNDLQLLEYRKEEADTRGGERMERYVVDRKRQMLKGTFFDRLELHWICTRDEVEAHWKKLSVEITPERIASADPKYKEDLEKIAVKMREAYDTLIDDKKRVAYRLEVIEKQMIEQSAEMLARKGDMAIMKGVKREAYDCFSKAVELKPNVPEFRDGFNRAKAMA